MSLSLQSFFAVLGPVVYIPAFVPLLIGILIWFVYYIRFDRGKMKKAGDSFRSLASAGEKIEDCTRENLLLLSEAVPTVTPGLQGAWERMSRQLSEGFPEGPIPEGRFFYDFEALTKASARKEHLDSLWRAFLVLGGFSVLLPFGVASFTAPMAALLALYLGGGVFLLLGFGFLLFTLIDQRSCSNARNEFERFLSVFDRVLPTVKSDVAIFLHTAARNREASESLAQSVTGQLDRIVDGTLLPLFQSSIETILKENLTPAVAEIGQTLDANLSKTLRLQETGMETMTADFADRLGKTVEVRIADLAASLGTVQENIHTLNDRLSAHANTLSETSERVLKAQEEEMKRIGASFTDTLSNTLNEQAATLSMAVSDVSGQLEMLSFGLGSHVTDLMDTTKTVLTQQKEQMENAVNLQDERIKLLTEQQTERVKLLTEQQANLMNQMSGRLSENVDRLSSMLDEQHQVLSKSVEMLLDSRDFQETAITESRAIQEKYLENNDVFVLHMQSMADTVGDFTRQTDIFSQDAFRFITETNEAQQRLAEGVTISQNKLEAAVNETMSQYARMNEMLSGMMDQITGRMNDAMANAGREIARGIKEVTADNAEAISSLAEQAKNLREEYDALFSGVEGFTAKTLDDMDYQVKTLIQRISEDVGEMLKANTAANGEILAAYKDNTTDLLQSFDEQARSIGLYAKEINLDITDLTGSLQASMGEFCSRIQEGVKLTLSEFDYGLAELTNRIANTVESISDAVEALPEALNRK